MRVLFIIEGLEVGGLTSSFLNLINLLQRTGDVDIAIGIIDSNTQSKLPQNCKIIDLSMFYRGYTSKIGKLRHYIKAGLLRRGLVALKFKYKKKRNGFTKELIPLVQKADLYDALANRETFDTRNQFDVVVSWCEMYTDYLLAFRIHANRKFAWIHPDYLQAGFAKETDTAMVSAVDGIVAVSKVGCESLKKAFPEFVSKCFFVYNKINTSELQRKSKLKFLSYYKNEINIITVARIQNVSKAFFRTLQAMIELASEGFRFKWRIIGNGEDTEALKTKINENNMGNHIEILGAMDNPFPYVCASDLFLLASFYEGFPMAVEEALALTVPVMITDYAAAYEQVENRKTGIIIENSEKGVYDGLHFILSNPDTLIRMRENLVQQEKKENESCKDFIDLLNNN